MGNIVILILINPPSHLQSTSLHPRCKFNIHSNNQNRSSRARIVEKMMILDKEFCIFPILPFQIRSPPRRARRFFFCSSGQKPNHTDDPTAAPPAQRPGRRASSQLSRWSRPRSSIRSAQRLHRSVLKKTTTPPPTPTLPPSAPSSDGDTLTSADGDADEEEDDGFIYMVSDGSGCTAEHSVNAALGQLEQCLIDRGSPVNTHPSSCVCPSSSVLKDSGKEKKKQRRIISKEFGALLQSCIDSKSLEHGKLIHSRIEEAGLGRDPDLLPKLVKLYSVCGKICDARNLFDGMSKRNLDAHSWTAMISGYIKNGCLNESFDLFTEMLELGVGPDSYTFSALLKASAELGSLVLTVQLHSMVAKCSFVSSLSVENSLIHAYSSLGDTCGAHRVFERMGARDVVSWCTMVQTCCSTGNYAEAMELFCRMQFEERLKPNEHTIVSLLPACGFFSSYRKGQSVHAYSIRKSFQSNVIVGSAIVSMYSRCGNPDAAYKIFCTMERKTIVLWTSMIEGYALNGRFRSAMDLFELMQCQGLKPNYITLVVILSACSHAGFVDEGLHIFENMLVKFGVKPVVEHYACIVDMLGRSGRLDDAEKFIQSKNIKPSGSVYGSLLGACQAHRNVEIGERVAYKLFELEPYNASNYVILSNIYASVGQWEDVGKLRQKISANGLLKDSGRSWIELKDRVYVFEAHDRSNVESDKIYEVLEELSNQIVKAGYVPSTNHVLLDVEEDEKKQLLCSHSERLAIAFGLLKSPPNAVIRVAKNLRVCGDCHEAIKFMSKVTLRELVIRDTSRFHHFSQGSCSCGDYW